MPSVTLAMTAIPASTTASRSDPNPHPGKLLRRDRVPRSPGISGSEVGQAQCPRQVQYRTRSTTPRMTLSSQWRGGRLPIRAWILSSPSPPGSTSPAASDKARRSDSSRPSSSGEVMPSPHLPATPLGLLLQDRLERRHRPSRVALHGASADPHRPRDVGLREVPVVPQHDGLPLPHRKHAQR